jgi:hypothetical protein
MKSKLIALIALILLIGCEKTELPNDLSGTKWQRVERNSSSGWQKEYDDKGNFTTIPFISTNILSIELIFIDNYSGIIHVKEVQKTDWQDGSNETNEDIFFDITSDFQYSYDSQSRKGKISCVLDFRGSAYESLIKDGYININEDFGLFFDSDDLWLKDKDEVFTKLE